MWCDVVHFCPDSSSNHHHQDGGQTVTDRYSLFSAVGSVGKKQEN